MILYCIYFNPSDFPGKYVVRKFEGMVPDESALIITNTLEDARSVIPKYAVMLTRAEDDDPVIVETWL